MLRTLALLIVCAGAAGCSSTEVASTGVAGNAAPTAVAAYAAPAQLPVSSYEGYWFVADDTERDCTVQFSTTPQGAATDIYAARPTGECVSSLRHIAGWGRRDGAIVLYGANGEAVGTFTGTGVLNYGGKLTIDTGQTFSATLRKVA